jgi:hypothetical protein
VKRSARKAKRIDWRKKAADAEKESAYCLKCLTEAEIGWAECGRKLAETENTLFRERRQFCDFMHDVEVILAHHSADAICGSKWIPAQALLNARKRYAERTSA